MESMHSKMFDPPTESPTTPDFVYATNPVPEVMQAAGLYNPSAPHTMKPDLMHGDKILTWDGLIDMMFFLIRDGDNPIANGTFPGPTYRIPRGAIFHGETLGHGPPPHTIHWHGIEPTPMNDGVGHCSMEIGHYNYQWQPNFIGFYFYHCHRNTVQHFEFGLYGALLIEPPDAYFASIAAFNADGTVTLNPAIPIGHCRDGRRRIACNLDRIKDQALAPVANPFAGFNNNPLTAPDPHANDPNLPAWLKFQTDPHAMTVPYDVEMLWVVDDRDSNWSEHAPNARATYPKHGTIPGVNDEFHGNWGGDVGPDKFFAFNDFNPDYFYVTGVPVPAHRIDKGGTGVGRIPAGVTIPAGLISGVEGVQVSVSAGLGQTVLLRCLDAAYVCAEYTFPVDVVVIAWDGRALGVPPYGEYNHPYLVPAGTPIHVSVARRFDALCRSDVEVNGIATVKFIDTRAQSKEDPNALDVLMTAEVPFYIGDNPPQPEVSSISGAVTNTAGEPMADVSIDVEPASQAGSEVKTKTLANGTYSAGNLVPTMYAITPSKAGFSFEPPMAHVTAMTNTGGFTNILNVNFVGKTAHKIAGKIMFKGAPLAGASLVLHGTPATSVVTDANGNFLLPDLPDGVYMIQPSLPGFEFTPAMANVTILGSDVIGLEFTATTIGGAAPPPSDTGGGGTVPPPDGGGSTTALAGGGGGGCFIDSLKR